VTVGFSDAVGEILVSNPKVARRLPVGSNTASDEAFFAICARMLWRES
jgi:hypothetical protein